MEVDWQQNDIFCVKERAVILLEKEILADVSFQFDNFDDGIPKILRAHKLFLANASSVFYAMFYGPMAEKTDKAIKVDGIDYTAFSIVLKYVYSNEVKLDDFEKATKVYAVAKKYLLNALLKYCIAFIEKQLNATNALEIYEFSNFFEEANLEQQALKIIRDKTFFVLQSPNFSKINIKTMITILEQDNLKATELELFEALEDLAKHNNVSNKKLSLANIDANINKSTELNNENAIMSFEHFREAVKKIHFLGMTAEQFASGPAFSKLLLSEEAVAILSCLVQRKNNMHNYPTEFTQNIRLKYLPHVFFDVNIAGRHGRFVIELRADVAPEAVEIFQKQISSLKFVPSCDSSYIALKVKKKFLVNLVLENNILKNDKLGVVFIKCLENKFCFNHFYIRFDDKKENCDNVVVFGQVIEGMDVVHALAGQQKDIEFENRGEYYFGDKKQNDDNVLEEEEMRFRNRFAYHFDYGELPNDL